MLAVLLVIYAVTISCGRPADRMLLHPPQGAIDAGGAVRRTIEVSGRALEIWVARSPALADADAPAAHVLEFCGNATRAEEIAQYVAQRWHRYPVQAWVVNYPGYGGSEGGARLKLIPPAALAAYDEIARRAPGRPIFLEANSLGTAAALYVAANRPVAGLVLQNPPPLRSLILGKYGWWNAWLAAGPVALQVPKDLDSIGNAKRVKARAVFLLADRDEVVPPAYQKRVVDAYAGENRVTLLPNATHGTPVRGEAVRQLEEAIAWLWEPLEAR